MNTIKGHIGIGTKVKGVALVAKDGFSARYDLDRQQGTFSRPAHKLYGESYLDKILVLDIAKGGVATAWMLYDMKAHNRAPLALLLNQSNPVMVQGAALADLPLIDRFDCDITEAVYDGDVIEVDPKIGIVTILSRNG